VRLHNAAVDFYDVSLKGSTHRLQIVKLDVDVGPLHLPALDKPTSIGLHGTLKGVQHDGVIAISGRLTPATRDAKIAAAFTGVDLIALQPSCSRSAKAASGAAGST